MAEKEYIEREAFIESQHNIYCVNCGRRKDSKGRFVYFVGDAPCRACGIMDVLDAVEDFSAADVRPVVQGKWSVQEIYKHEMSYGTTAYEPVYKCSACGNLMESYLRYDEPIMPEDADFPRFCPNCGADMREES